MNRRALDELKQQIPLLDYLQAHDWKSARRIRGERQMGLCPLHTATVTGGHYQDAFGRNRAIWKTFTISAFDTPNLHGVIEQLLAMSDDELAVAPAPYLVTRRWVKERYLRWGTNHPMYRARVLGEFPEQSELSVYSLAWIERASHEPEPLHDRGPGKSRTLPGVPSARTPICPVSRGSA